MRVHPYEISNKSIDEPAIKLNPGTKVIVNEAVKNGLNNLWFHVKINDMEGYIFCNRLIPDHAHDLQYFNSGQCGICGAWLPNKNGNDESIELGVYTVPMWKKAYIREHPYEISNANINKPIDTLHFGEEVEVTGAVRNGFNNLWYEVSYKQQRGYIFSDRLVLKHKHDSDYRSTGVCNQCGAVLPNKNDDEQVELGLYMLNKGNIYLHQYPYQKSTRIMKVPYKEEVQVIGAVKNAFDNVWYEILYKKNMGIFIKSIWIIYTIEQ